MTLLFPSSGTAQILGRDISDRSVHSRIGYCPENPYFYDYLTARELMNYFGELFQLEPKVRKRRTEELLTKVGLDEKDWNKQLRKFSKGMLQRVGLAQSLINEPEIVFLDEPMSGLDPIGRREIRELIANLPATARQYLCRRTSFRMPRHCATKLRSCDGGDLRPRVSFTTL
jgi:ABC-2 type transport system ATP-binding protein